MPQILYFDSVGEAVSGQHTSPETELEQHRKDNTGSADYRMTFSFLTYKIRIRKPSHRMVVRFL